ncbi:MAG: Interferon-induced, double-stranded RNA-activated protein kinase [Trizodia sp. TS-e1964]|nr:MAG: Interferon-induced, double-stranded RNA-activated protein kinase [Trizodia sp. TS-e1964]
MPPPLNAPSLKVELSLDEYERKLLTNFASLYNKSLDRPTAPDESRLLSVSKHWLWRRQVVGNFRDVLRQEVLQPDWDDDVEQAYRMFIHFAVSRSTDPLYFRSDALTATNPELLPAFLEMAKTIDPVTIELETCSAAADIAYWVIINDLYFDNIIGQADSLTTSVKDWYLRVPVKVPALSDDEMEDIDENEADEENIAMAIQSLAVASRAPPRNKTDLEIDSVRKLLKGKATASGVFKMAELSTIPTSEDDEDEDEDDEGWEDELMEEDGDKDENWEDMGDEEDSDEDDYLPFTIWSLLRKSSILRRRRHLNAVKIMEFMHENDFFSYHLPVDRDLFSRSPDYEVWYTGAQARIRTLKTIIHALHHGLDGSVVIEDPRQFLEFIPWEELDFKDPGLHALWNPPMPILDFERHLYTEEDVMRYCVLNDFNFPGLYQEGKIAFFLAKIDENFIDNFHKYWNRWSDCAVTQDPQTKTWYLVETSPGKVFRQIWDDQDRCAAQKYFRNIVNRHKFGLPTLLKESLGIKYEPKCERVAELIPFDQFEVDKDQTPINGSHGYIYKAVWKEPHKIAKQSCYGEWVVLKSICFQNRDDLDSIFRELDAHMSALEGDLRFTKFHGITCPGETLPSGSPFGEEMQNRIFIVSDCALVGPADEYIKANLSGGEPDWALIIHFIWNLAEGLVSIHSKGAVHRDLHWGNILVTTSKNRNRFMRSSLSLGKNAEILITDFGEGKVLGGTSPIGRKYGSPEFRAPELESGSAEYTSAADMYSVGILTKQIVQWHWEEARKRHYRSPVISTTIQEILEKLLKSKDPNDRPSAHDIMELLAPKWPRGVDFYGDLDLVRYVKEVGEDEEMMM